jgi:hypothetical protein
MALCTVRRGRSSHYTEYAPVTGFAAGAKQDTTEGGSNMHLLHSYCDDSTSSSSSSSNSDANNSASSSSSRGWTEVVSGSSTSSGNSSSSSSSCTSMTLESLRQQLAAFVGEREWGALHTPRDLCLALR